MTHTAHSQLVAIEHYQGLRSVLGNNNGEHSLSKFYVVRQRWAGASVHLQATAADTAVPRL